MRPSLIIAHRGSSIDAPENTLRAFRKALAVGVDAIELDVHTTRDGVPVVFHDTDTRRLTGFAGRISKLSWAKVRQLRVRKHEPIPRLVEVLRTVTPQARVQIELKRGVNVWKVVTAIRAARAVRRVIIGSFEMLLLAKAQALAPKIPRMVITEGRSSTTALLRQLLLCRAIGLSVNHRSIPSRNWVAGFQSHGFAVWTWTVNRPTAMRRLARTGVDGILSDNPALLRSEIRVFSSCFPYVRGRTNRDDNPARFPLR